MFPVQKVAYKENGETVYDSFSFVKVPTFLMAYESPKGNNCTTDKLPYKRNWTDTLPSLKINQ